MNRSKGPFGSFLRHHLDDYLRFRQQLGYTSTRKYEARDLDYYVMFFGLRSIDQLTEGEIVRWIHLTPRNPATKNRLILFARGFFRYLTRHGIAKTNPAERIACLRPRPYRPHIYSLKEIQSILEEAAKPPSANPRNPLIGITLRTILLLTYACGLRLSEALKLRIRDVSFEEDTLSLWRTKFHKERLVPFSPAMSRELKGYLDERRRVFEATDESAFFCHAGGAYDCVSIGSHFRRIIRSCGLWLPDQGRNRPRIHDLRHTFAVHRLYKWYQEGHDLLNRLPWLSTYMGHINIESTQYYLTITLALLREADRRFQGTFESIMEKPLRRTLKKR